ncbi:MAG: aspartate aminotransferase family protein [Bacillota bacterium]|jgi:adenosylmethionine-8-amino-7-oxononanoate aminotransferase
MGRRYMRRKIRELRQSLLEEMKKNTQLEQVIVQLKELEPLVNTLKELEPMISVLNELAPRFDQIKEQVMKFNPESGLEVESKQEQEIEPGINSSFNLEEEVLWNPLTGFQECGIPDPIIIKKGQGNCVFDVGGNQYLDGISALWTIMGHKLPLLEEIENILPEPIKNEVLKNTLGNELAQKLAEIAPVGLNKVFFSDAHVTALEIALKIAVQYWQNHDDPRYTKKKNFISFLQTNSASQEGLISPSLVFRGYQVPPPYCYRCPYGFESDSCQQECLKEVENIMIEHGEEIAALIIEPLVHCSAGVIISPPGYLKGIRDLCSKHQILLIADETSLGLGRTGTMFACEQESISPDILCTAKGLTGGYLPLAATLVQNNVYSLITKRKTETQQCFGTGNPLACALALTNIAQMKQEDLFGKLQPNIEFLEQEIQKLHDLKYVGDVRQKGYLVGIELVEDKDTKKRFSSDRMIGYHVFQEAAQKGLLIYPLQDVVILMPPLSMSSEELSNLIDIIYQAIKAI